jgi:hypothetical protein
MRTHITYSHIYCLLTKAGWFHLPTWHDILLNKLNTSGPSSWYISWFHSYILSCVTSVTIEGFRIDDRIFGLFDRARALQFTIHYYKHIQTSVNSHVFNSRCSVAASNPGRSPSSGLKNYQRHQLPVSHGNSSQRLNCSSLTNSVTHQLTNLNQLTLTDSLAV